MEDKWFLVEVTRQYEEGDDFDISGRTQFVTCATTSAGAVERVMREVVFPISFITVYEVKKV